MNQGEFIKQYTAENPEASVNQVLDAWNSYRARLGGKAKKRHKADDTISAFCESAGISRQAYYQKLEKWAPMYASWLKERKN